MKSASSKYLSDRTQAPSGAGYSLENRIVLSRALPSVYRQCNVQRLAPFFVSLRETLAGLAPANHENPRIVLLTPGPYNETYFEHSFLARYLGYTLVQGNDLTVRDTMVYMKTLGGLQRVDVILRRVDDNFCDPLELYPDSYLGVPGLLQAVRRGNVAVANAIGCGVLQAPGFLPFLPAVCRYLLGEDLKLPSVETWWCGQPDILEYVMRAFVRDGDQVRVPDAGRRPCVRPKPYARGTLRAGTENPVASRAFRGAKANDVLHDAGADRRRGAAAALRGSLLPQRLWRILHRHERRALAHHAYRTTRSSCPCKKEGAARTLGSCPTDPSARFRFCLRWRSPLPSAAAAAIYRAASRKICTGSGAIRSAPTRRRAWRAEPSRE